MIKIAAYIGLGLYLSTVGLVYAADISSEEVLAAEEKAKASKMEHKRLQAEAIKLSLELAKINQNMIDAAEKLQNDEEKTTKLEEELELLEKKLKVTEEAFNKEYRNLAGTLASLENLALHPTESLLIQPLSPTDTVKSAILLRESVPFLKTRADKIKQDLEEISLQKKQVEKKLEEISTQKSSLKKQQQNLKRLSSEKARIRKQIEGESEKAQEEAVKLASEASDLRDLMEKLEHDKEIKRRRSEEIKRAAKERAEQKRLEAEQLRRLREGQGSGLRMEDGSLYEEDTSLEDMQTVDLINIKPQSITEGIDFIKARGSLARPVRGEIITSYGQELSKGVTSKGLVIKTRGQAQVISPYDGSVIFSGPFKGYGNLIIIEHDNEYVSLLAGMGLVDTQIGQMVLAGEPVGIMPEGDSAKLYVEIRKNQKPINPQPWFGN